MTKFLIVVIVLCMTLCSCKQTIKDNSKDGVTIDPNIKEEVEKNISTSQFSVPQAGILIYNNLMVADFYENDQLVVSTKEDDN